MIELRWLITRNKVTVEMVLAERDRTGDSVTIRKARLVNETKPILQQYFDGKWIDIPLAIEERE